MKIRTSFLQKIPGVFRWYRHLLPIMSLAARGLRLDQVDLVISLSHCVAKAVVPPPAYPTSAIVSPQCVMRGRGGIVSRKLD